MNTEKKSAEDLNKIEATWKNALLFAEDELKILNQRLGEISIRNTAFEVKQEIEKYQNQFIRQKEVIDELKHEIKLEAAKLIEDYKNNPTAFDHRKFEVPQAISEKLDTFVKIYKGMKNNFQEFASKWI